MDKLYINSIYRATEGEGLLLGIPQIFVRFQGCAIACMNCDSKETWDFDQNSLKTLESVVDEIQMLSHKGVFPVKRVSITGGDPLHPKLVPGVLALIKELKKDNFYINLEAAGTRIVDEIFELVDFISFDYKTPSTGVKTNPELIKALIQNYPGKFQIKSVVADKKDFEASYDTFMNLYHDTKVLVPWCVTPCFEPSEQFPMSRFQEVINFNEDFGGPFRVIGQQHKWVFGPDQKQV
jgi:7-carboxy-7-deazaguanine synthase